jgi:hypothetical protein
MSAHQRLLHIHFAEALNPDSHAEKILDVLAGPQVNCPQGCKGRVTLTTYVMGDSSGPYDLTPTYLSWSIADLRLHGSATPEDEDLPGLVVLKKGFRPHGFCEKCGTTVSLTAANEAAVVSQACAWVEQHWPNRYNATKHP